MVFATAALLTDLEDGAVQVSPKVFKPGNRAVTPARRIARLERFKGQDTQLLDRAHIAVVQGGYNSVPGDVIRQSVNARS